MGFALCVKNSGLWVLWFMVKVGITLKTENLTVDKPKSPSYFKFKFSIFEGCNFGGELWKI